MSIWLKKYDKKLEKIAGVLYNILLRGLFPLIPSENSQIFAGFNLGSSDKEIL